MKLHSFNKGDLVSVIDDNINGKIINIQGSRITIEDEFGFPNYYNANQLILRKSLDAILPEKIIIKDKKTTTVKKEVSKKKQFLEVDLHIHQITTTNRNMSNHDMLEYQLDYAKNKMQFAIKNRIPKIIFIHGKGKGVLKKALVKMVTEFPVEIKDASYQKYGFGAIEVSIFLSKT
ncbi:MAG TPA: DNA mismatch repair protein MutS [Flavobacteriia bacterium]|nr:DNA mismatch repair protein MutS [Flavobacteriia bacterium]